jgi:hypothetical protein
MTAAIQRGEAMRNTWRSLLPRSVGILVASVVGLAAGCGNGSDAAVETQAAQDMSTASLEEIGACPETGDINAANPAEFVAAVETWLHVDLEAAKNSSALDADRTRSSEQRLSVANVAADGRQGETFERSLRLHGSLLSSIDWSTTHPGANVYLGVGGEDYDGQVLFAVVIDDEGRFGFAGECQYRLLTQPLRRILGDDSGAFTKVLGLTGKPLETALGLNEPPHESTVSVLNPQDASPEDLAGLELVTVVLEVPSDWTGPATLCTRIERGWNDCVPLDGTIKFPTPLSVYVSPGSPLEVWLLDEQASLETPRQMLGTVATPDSVTARDLVRVTVTGSLSADARSVGSPRVSSSDWEVAKLDG